MEVVAGEPQVMLFPVVPADVLTQIDGIGTSANALTPSYDEATGIGYEQLNGVNVLRLEPDGSWTVLDQSTSSEITATPAPTLGATGVGVDETPSSDFTVLPEWSGATPPDITTLTTGQLCYSAERTCGGTEVR